MKDLLKDHDNHTFLYLHRTKYHQVTLFKTSYRNYSVVEAKEVIRVLWIKIGAVPQGIDSKISKELQGPYGICQACLPRRENINHLENSLFMCTFAAVFRQISTSDVNILRANDRGDTRRLSQDAKAFPCPGGTSRSWKAYETRCCRVQQPQIMIFCLFMCVCMCVCLCVLCVCLCV